MVGSVKIFPLLIFILCSFFSFAQKDKKKDESKISETIKTLGSPADELTKRAVYWVKLESSDYTKSSAVTSGSKAECTISYPVKQDDLNPECDYTGKITMKILIECSNNQYTYTIFNMRHTSDSGKATGGDIGKEEPECGTSVMPMFTWRYVRNGALNMARSISSDIKEGMMKSSSELEKGE